MNDYKECVCNHLKGTSKNPILTQRYKKFAIMRRMCEGAIDSFKRIQRLE